MWRCRFGICWCASSERRATPAAERTAEARRAERYAELDPASLRNTLARFGLLGMQACSPSELAAASAAHDVIAPSDVLASLRARPRAVPTDPSAVLAADAARAAELEAIRKVAESLPRPDIDNMTPFLPLEDPDAAGGAGTALGVLRPSLRGVLERLPSARSYNGPIIDAEIVVRLLLATRIPPHVRLDTLDAFTPAAAREVALSSAAAATLKRKQPPGSAANAIGGGGGGGGGGVGGGVGGDDDVPFGGTHTVSTSTDIFRARRADKVRRGI
jgi:hypothetical protein